MISQDALFELFLKQSIKDYNGVIDSFLKDPSSIFADKNEQTGLFFDALTRKLANWKKSKECIYRNCKEKSIKKSHTIAKSAFLSVIAEKGHLYTPALNYKTYGTEIKKIGVNDASTFPGFCQDHEKLFFAFEQSKRIAGDSDAFRQIYRTICREIVIKEFRLNTILHLRDSYKKFRDGKLFIEIKKLPIMKLIERNSKISNFEYEGSDALLNSFDTEIKNLKRDIRKFRGIYFKRIHDELELKSKKQFFCGMNITVKGQVPVALAGRGNFVAAMDINSEPKTIELITIVLPSENETTVIIFSSVENEEYIKGYVERFLRQDFGIINMIESWMMYGSDHWFIKPSIWEKITAENQKVIVSDIMDPSKRISSFYPKTIFNDFKRDRLLALIKLKSNEEFEKMIIVENGKFTDAEVP